MRTPFGIALIIATCLCTSNLQAAESIVTQAVGEAVPYYGPQRLLHLIEAKDGGEWKLGQIEVPHLKPGESYPELKARIAFGDHQFEYANPLKREDRTNLGEEEDRRNLLLSPFTNPGTSSRVAFLEEGGTVVPGSVVMLPSFSSPLPENWVRLLRENQAGFGDLAKNLDAAVQRDFPLSFCGWQGLAQDGSLSADVIVALLHKQDPELRALAAGACVASTSKFDAAKVASVIEQLKKSLGPQDLEKIAASLYAQSIFSFDGRKQNTKPYTALHTLVKDPKSLEGAQGILWDVLKEQFKKDLFPVDEGKP